MTQPLLVLMTGLPAAGKTTTGRLVAERLGLPFFDKDEILETLFDSLGSPTPDDRTRLSRASDAVLAQLALASDRAVLSSFWRLGGMPESSGTSAAWLAELTGPRTIVEVWCRCDPAVAAQRFLARPRHPGHHDSRHTLAALTEAFERLDAAGPLLDAEPIVVSTDHPVDLEVLAATVLSRLGRGTPQPG